MKRKTLTYFFLELVVLALFFPLIIYGQSAQSNCVITKVGSPGGAPQLPPGCQFQNPNVPIEGLISPPGLQCSDDGYCKMPDSDDGSYRFYSCEGQHYGSKLLIDVLYTVAKRWRQVYPQGYLWIGDLNASGHASHKWGRAVDLVATTNNDTDEVADFTKGNYNRDATIELGKMFADTNMVQNIWYNDQTVNNEVLYHANNTGRSAGMVMQPISGHDNHFHLDVALDPFLNVWEPGC